MILVSILYIFDYILNEKFEIEYSKYYSPITREKREFLDTNPELNPQLNFIFDGKEFINKNYSSNFVIYEKLIDKYNDNVDFLNITQNVSSFHLELLYLCKDINDDECSLREEDKSISKLQNYFGFQLGVPAFF